MPLFSPRLVAECLPLALMQKQVRFDLANDLDNAPSLPMDLANFLGEDITHELIDTPHPLLPQLTIPHSYLMTIATNAIPPIWEELNPKSALPSQRLQSSKTQAPGEGQIL